MSQSRLSYWYHQQLSRDLALKIPQYRFQDWQVTPVIVINVCSNQAVSDKRKLIPLVLALEIITNQRGLLTQARCSLSTWRLKKGMDIGIKITLNNKKMWNFLDQLVNIILPNLIYFKKFNGISYDQSGNLGLGFKNLDVFSEIEWLREHQHIITQLGFLTGINIVIIWKKSLPINSIVCRTSNYQLIFSY